MPYSWLSSSFFQCMGRTMKSEKSRGGGIYLSLRIFHQTCSWTPNLVLLSIKCLPFLRNLFGHIQLFIFQSKQTGILNYVNYMCQHVTLLFPAWVASGFGDVTSGSAAILEFPFHSVGHFMQACTTSARQPEIAAALVTALYEPFCQGIGRSQGWSPSAW